jgi:2-polyprenyl-3-methyl-5-hydroxy-6-metoxy-1,4-benzoquinol methylase
LDVGCGNGDFPELAKRAGWEAFGVELSEHAAAFARSKGLNVVCGTLETAGYAAGFFDVITMWDVLEHLDHPRRAVEEAHRLLKGGGYLVVRVPNTKFQLLKAFIREDVLRGKRSSLQGNLHLNHFSATTLRRLLTSAGFEVVREEAGVSEDKVHQPRTPLWFKKAYCSTMEVLRKTTSIQLGPTVVQCARKILNGNRTTPQ